MVPGPPPAGPTMPGVPVPAVPTVPAAPPAAPVPNPPAGPPAPVTQDGITIAAVTPAHGPAAGGTVVMITGSGLPAGAIVLFGGVPAYVAGGGVASLTVRTPSGTPGASVDVTVTDYTGRSASMRNAFRYDADSSVPGSAPGAGTQPDPVPGAGSQPSPGGSAPDPGTTAPQPAAPGTPSPQSPAGTVLRPPPQLGAVTVVYGLRVAPVVGGDPLSAAAPGTWSNWRCTTVLCDGVVVR